MKTSKGKGKKSQVVKNAKKQSGKADTVVKDGAKAEERVTLIERVIRESEEVQTGKGKKRDIARMAFALWLTIPARWRGAPDSIVDTLGITDPDILELIKIKNVEGFKAACHVSHQAVAEWRKEIVDDDKLDHRVFFKKLMTEGLAALYRKLIENGDADRFKAFAGYVEGWMPGLQLHHSGAIDTLDDEERAELDKLIEKNKVKL